MTSAAPLPARPRLLVVAAGEVPPAFGGAATWLRELLCALRSRHQVGLVVPADRDGAAVSQAVLVPVFNVPPLAAAGAVESLRRASALAAFAREQEVDVV